MSPATGLTTGRVLTLDAHTEHPRELVGGKAWSIQKMMSLGISVPPAVVLTTDVCREYYRLDRSLPEGVWEELLAALASLGERTGRRFGVAERPLLVSVRSGAAISMPGMMDTVLNLGMTDAIEAALAAETGDPVYAADTRRRFIEQFEKVVGKAPPTDPNEQLRFTVQAVLESWHSKRAMFYRASRGISDDGGTAVTVQAMVFGNLDHRSGTGVLFSRDPLTGSADPYGEWLPRGQGEDVVSGRCDALALQELAEVMPEVHRELLSAAAVLERAGRDVQDIEFTVQSGKLWLLQSRAAKRSPQAALRCAVHLQRDGVITASEAIDRVAADHVRALLRSRLSGVAAPQSPPVAFGKPACPGTATGVVVTDAEEAVDRADQGEAVVLARPTTDPDDVAGMSASVAVLTEFGGSTSHAAVVCRELGVPSVVGCGPETVTKLAGRVVTVDAAAGTVHLGEVTVQPAPSPDDDDLRTLESWLRDDLGDYDSSVSVLTLLERRAGIQQPG